MVLCVGVAIYAFTCFPPFSRTDIPTLFSVFRCRVSLGLAGCVAIVHVKLRNVVMLPATLPDLESGILCCKDIPSAKIT